MLSPLARGVKEGPLLHAEIGVGLSLDATEWEELPSPTASIPVRGGASRACNKGLEVVGEFTTLSF